MATLRKDHEKLVAKHSKMVSFCICISVCIKSEKS